MTVCVAGAWSVVGLVGGCLLASCRWSPHASLGFCLCPRCLVSSSFFVFALSPLRLSLLGSGLGLVWSPASLVVAGLFLFREWPPFLAF